MSENYECINVVFPNFGRFGAPDSGHSSDSIALSKGFLFLPRNADFWQKNAESKTKGMLVLQGIFSEITYACLL